MPKAAYGSRWRKARRQFLDRNPWCVKCHADGKRTLANVVDHIRPHRGDPDLFWDAENWQPLCKRHHDSDKQREERTGVLIGCDEAGWPTNPGHHWQRGGGSKV